MSKKPAKSKAKLKVVSCDDGLVKAQALLSTTTPGATLHAADRINVQQELLPPDWQRGLPPVVNENSVVLVLGTFPGTQSLLRQEYYAGPGNRFWCLIGKIFGYEGDLRQQDYSVKKRFVIDHGVALWDVAESALRVGAADSAIKDWNPTDLPRLLQRYPGINRIILNGGKGEKMFNTAKDMLGKENPPRTIRIPHFQCGSTSGANQQRFPWPVLYQNWLPHF
jgi:hypoxanthine-DNA glycosylase